MRRRGPCSQAEHALDSMNSYEFHDSFSVVRRVALFHFQCAGFLGQSEEKSLDPAWRVQGIASSKPHGEFVPVLLYVINAVS